MQVAVTIGSVRGKTRQEYKKAIRQYKALENRIIDTAGAYQVQLEEGENINSSTIKEGYTIAGVGSQKFINLASYLTLKNQEADGVSITRKTEDNGDIVINGTIDINGEGYKNYEEAGLIDPEDGELTYNNENNTASFTWRSSSSNPAKELVLKRLKGFNAQEASINAGLENEKGDLNKRLYTGERSSRVEKFKEDPNREQDITKIYIDPSVIEENVAFRADAQAFAEQIRVPPAHQRDDYILRTHGKEILEEFKNADFAKQDDIIYRELMLRNIERLTGVEEGSGLIKKEGDKYYIEEYGTPRNVTPRDSETTTEQKLRQFDQGVIDLTKQLSSGVINKLNQGQVLTQNDVVPMLSRLAKIENTEGKILKLQPMRPGVTAGGADAGAGYYTVKTNLMETLPNGTQRRVSDAVRLSSKEAVEKVEQLKEQNPNNKYTYMPYLIVNYKTPNPDYETAKQKNRTPRFIFSEDVYGLNSGEGINNLRLDIGRAYKSPTQERQAVTKYDQYKE